MRGTPLRMALFGAIALLGQACGKPAFPTELFTVSADDADYPIMLSRTKSPARGGRPVAAQSGTNAEQSQSTYRFGDSTVTVTRASAAASELSASVKLAAKVRRTDRWVQLERATFHATDFATYGASSNERMLNIEAKIYK